MAYEGEILDRCGLLEMNFSQASAVVVSGAVWNPCGHLLLNVGGECGHYCHVAGFRGFPRYMDEIGYQKYLQTSSKRELRRTLVPLSDPSKSLFEGRTAVVQAVDMVASASQLRILRRKCASGWRDQGGAVHQLS